MTPPQEFSALPPADSRQASPKTISGRTSYIRVRLEFLRYPQVIPDYFNRRGFGPPQRFTIASTCSWLGHQVSGLRLYTSRPVQTRFRFGSVTLLLNLAYNRNSPAHSTKGTIPDWLPVVLYLLVSTRFQVLFHSPPGVLFTFPSRYWFTIGHQGVFSLGGWSLLLPTGFLVSRGTQDTSVYRLLSLTGFLPSAIQLSNCVQLAYCQLMKSYNPRP